jgi:hypothetical protein
MHTQSASRSFTFTLAAAGLLLTACAGRPLVVPRTNAMYEQYRQVDAGAPCFGQFDRFTIPSFDMSGSPEFTVGVSNWYIPGADPVPCWRRRELRSLGLIRWDFRIADALIAEGRTLERAELVQRFERGYRNYDYFEGSTLADVKIAAEAWEARSRRADPSDPSVNVAMLATPVITTVPFSPTDGSERVDDVTSLVRDWMSGARPNYGLVWDSVTFGLGEQRTFVAQVKVFVELRLHFSEP